MCGGKTGLSLWRDCMLGVGGSLPVTEVTIRTRQLLLAFSHAMLSDTSQQSVRNPHPNLTHSLTHSLPPPYLLSELSHMHYQILLLLSPVIFYIFMLQLLWGNLWNYVKQIKAGRKGILASFCSHRWCLKWQEHGVQGVPQLKKSG